MMRLAKTKESLPYLLLERYGLCLVVVFFVALSATGLMYNVGLTTTVNDETPPLAASLRMIGEGTLRPDFPTFYYPALSAYAFLPFAIASLLSLPFLGVPLTVDEIRAFVTVDFGTLLPFARAGAVVFGALTVAAMYAIGMQVFRDRRIALLVSFLTATSLFLVQLSHFGRVWSLHLLAIASTLWAAFALFDERYTERRRYAFGAFGAASAFGVDLVGGIAFASVFVSHLLRHQKPLALRDIFDRRMLSAMSLLLLLCVAVYWLNPNGFGFFRASVHSYDASAAVAGGLSLKYCPESIQQRWMYYPIKLVGYEPLLSLLFAAAVIPFYRRYRSPALILGTFFVSYLVILTIISASLFITCEPRYASPLTLPMVVVVGWGLWKIREILGGFRGIIFLSFALFGFASLPVLYDLRLGLPSTRLEVRKWIVANIPDGSRVVSFEEKLDLPENLTTIERMEKEVPGRMTRKRSFLLAHPERIGTHAYDIYYPTYALTATTTFFTSSTSTMYVIASWWNAGEKGKILDVMSMLPGVRSVERIVLVPSYASETGSLLDLPNNMDAPALHLWGLRQNGPTIAIYRTEGL